MDERSFDILRDRYLHKLTLAEIGEKHDITGERASQLIQDTLNYLLSARFHEKWKHQNDIPVDIKEDMFLFILSMDLNLRDKLIRIIRHYDLKSPQDFKKLDYKQLTAIKTIGQKFVIHLKIAMHNFGIPYDSTGIEELEDTLDALHKKNTDKTNSGMRLRYKILKRDGFKCQYCGKSPRIDPLTVLQVDHIKPISRGGVWNEDNLITACSECNLGKGNFS